MTEERQIQELRQRQQELREDLKSVDKEHLDRYHSLKGDVATVGLLVEAAKRTEVSLSDHDDRLNDVERSCGRANDRLDNHAERLRALEAMNVAVLAEQVKDLRGQVRWLIVSFTGMIISILIGIIVFLINSRAVG